MKKFKSLLLVGTVVLFALNGCSGGDDDVGGNGGAGNTYNDVYLADLEQGYSIKGYSDRDEEVEFRYCNNSYEYYRDNEEFSGTFNIDDDEIEMHDDASGTYVLIVDTYDDNTESLLIKDKTYACPSLGRDLTVESISLITCN